MLHCLSALYSLYSVGIDHLGCGGACARAFHLSWLYIWDGWAKFITGIIRHNSTDAKTAAITYSSGELVLLWLPFSFVFHLVIVQPIDRYLMIVSKAWIFDCNPFKFLRHLTSEILILPEGKQYWISTAQRSLIHRSKFWTRLTTIREKTTLVIKASGIFSMK